jgi:membrane protein implicated in regulation of membrane protease activity
MTDWWNHLSAVQQVFYCIAIPSSLILLIQTVLALIGVGGDHGGDMHADAHMDAHDGTSEAQDIAGLHDFRFFTIRGIFAFLVIFGWVGVAMLAGNANIALTFIISAVGGLAAMFLIALMFYGINRMQESGNINYSRALGKKAEVYLFIPPRRSGKGKIQIELQERLIEADAVTDDDRTIKTGAPVEVCGVQDGNVLVVRRMSNK